MMDKSILELVADFPAWKGDSYRLSALVADRQREIDREKLVSLGFEEAAEAL